MSIDTFNSNKVNAEWKALLPSPSPKCGSTQKQYYPSAALNPTKNRYPDVLAYEQTLVPLSTGQYINANFTQTSPCTTFISTQGPLPQTFDDFWQMVWVCFFSLHLFFGNKKLNFLQGSSCSCCGYVDKTT